MKFKVRKKEKINVGFKQFWIDIKLPKNIMKYLTISNERNICLYHLGSTVNVTLTYMRLKLLKLKQIKPYFT